MYIHDIYFYICIHDMYIFIYVMYIYIYIHAIYKYIYMIYVYMLCMYMICIYLHAYRYKKRRYFYAWPEMISGDTSDPGTHREIFSKLYYPIFTHRSNICCPRDCVSRHNWGTSGAPLKPLRDDSALIALYRL